ncbi:neurotensin receptor type 1-like [Glandiceps talaboti]
MDSNSSESNRTFNLANSTDSREYPDISIYLYSKDQEILVTIVMPILLILGILLNFAFLFVVARITSMRTITNYYLVNLAIADTLYITFAVSDKLIRYYDSPLVIDQSALGEVGCMVVNGTVDVCYYVSLFTVTLFTIERFIAIMFPLKAKIFSSKKRTRILIVVTWVFGIGVSVPAILGNGQWSEYNVTAIGWPQEVGDVILPESFHSCYSANAKLAYAAQAINVFPFFLSMIVVAILNLIICIKITRGNKQLGDSQRTQSSIKARNQIVRMLVVTSMLFFVLLFPFEFAAFVPILDPDSRYGIIPEEIYHTWSQVARILSYLNSVINPIIYNAMSERYRRAFIAAFCCTDESKPKKQFDVRNENVHNKSNSGKKVGNDIPIEPVSCDSSRVYTEDIVIWI